MPKKLTVNSLLAFAGIIFFIALVIFIFSKLVSKETDDHAQDDRFDKNFSTPFFGPSAPPSIILNAKSLPDGPSCEPDYARFIDDGILTLSIFMGYKDSRPSRFVGDSIEALILVEKLMAPCEGRQETCNFTLVGDQPLQLEKNVQVGKSKFKTKITIWHSSLTLDDDLNRNLSAQNEYSKTVELAFAKAIKQNDIVFYNGHSRDGGGPDFFPPKLDSNHKTQYNWYVKNEPGLKLMANALKDSKKPLVLGLFSCASDKYFKSVLFNEKKDLSLITSSHLLYYADALKNLYGGIHGAIHLLCKEPFNSAIRSHVQKEGSTLQTQR